jgi:hypothetical protein
MAEEEVLLECRACLQLKPLNSFTNDSRHPRRHGKQSYCRECMAEYAKQRVTQPGVRDQINQRRRETGSNAAYQKQVRLTDPERSRAHTLKYKYGVTLEWFERKLEEQGGRCACCGTVDAGGPSGVFHIDHDHSCCPGKRSCGKCLRGLLCNRCNWLLGHAKDDVATLRAAIDYLTGQRIKDSLTA